MNMHEYAYFYVQRVVHRCVARWDDEASLALVEFADT